MRRCFEFYCFVLFYAVLVISRRWYRLKMSQYAFIGLFLVTCCTGFPSPVSLHRKMYTKCYKSCTYPVWSSGLAFRTHLHQEEPTLIFRPWKVNVFCVLWPHVLLTCVDWTSVYRQSCQGLFVQVLCGFLGVSWNLDSCSLWIRKLRIAANPVRVLNSHQYLFLFLPSPPVFCSIVWN